MKKLFLLDAYALIYRAFYAFINSPRINSKGENTSAVFGFNNTLFEVLRDENPTHIAVVFDPSGKTFRHEIYEPYKAQREETPEVIRFSVPIIKQLVKAYNIPVVEVAGYEADDVIGTLAYKASAEGYEVFMMTPDKDYGQLVGDHRYIYKPRKGAQAIPEIIGPEEICSKYGIDNPIQVVDLLGLMGDASDNIPGCPGVGERRAIDLIHQFGGVEGLINNTAQLKGAMKEKVENNIEQIRLSYFLATIKTDVPVEFNADEFKRQAPNIQALREIFSRLEFVAQLQKLNASANSGADDNAAKTVGGASVNVDNASHYIVATDSEETVVNNITININDCKTIAVDEASVDATMTALLAELQTQEVVTLSIEVPSKVALIDAQPTSLSLMFGGKAMVISFNTDNVARTALLLLKPFFENDKISKQGFNLKPLCVLLLKESVNLNGTLFDCEVAHYLINPEHNHSIYNLAQVLLGTTLTPYDEQTAEKHVKEKILITQALADVLKQQIEDKELHKLCYELEMPLVPVLAQMEVNGALIDDFALAQLSEQYTLELKSIESNIYQLVGSKDFNVNSPKQIGQVLFDKLQISDKPKRTKTGQYVTDEETLQGLKDAHPIVNAILEYRGIKKLLSTYIDALPTLVNRCTGRIHASFNQTVTATGRLSSSNPNLQNIPIRDERGREIRKAFIPNEGELFLSADYSQVELRLMAHLSGDTQMIEAFNNDQDIHAITAAKIYHVALEEVTSDMRRKAKTANFGIIYGISAFGLAERLNIPRKEAKELIDGYFEHFPSIKQYINNSIEQAREKGYVQTLFGRKRYLADINSHNANVRAFAERNAVNAPIQGTAADIMKLAMVKIHNRLRSEHLNTKLLIQVHDELDFTVPTYELGVVKALVKEEMESAFRLTIPLKAEVGVGDNWLEAH